MIKPSTYFILLIYFLFFIQTDLITINAQSNFNKQKVMYFSGSSYEIAFQKSKLNINDIEKWKGISNDLFDGSDSAALKLAYQFRLTEIEENFPDLLDEWRGMADAAQILFDDVAIFNFGERSLRKTAGLSIENVSEKRDRLEGCSAFALSFSDRGPVLGKTSDKHNLPNPPKIYDDSAIEILEYANSYKIMMCGYAILNDQGLAVGDANAHYNGTTGSGDGKGGKLAPIIARYCPDADSAVSFIKRYQITDDGRHFCVADKNGKAAAIEKGPGDLINVKWADSTGYVYITNTSLSDSMRIHDNNDVEYQLNSDSRLQNFEQMFTDNSFQFTFQSAKDIITSHDSSGAICQHGDEFEWQWHTDRSRLILPAEGKLFVAARSDSSDSWHPCENEWREYQLEMASTVDFKPMSVNPKTIKLNQNYPNPFNAQTTVSYEIGKDTYVKISIFNLLGKKVRTLRNGFHGMGVYSIMWNGKDDFDQDVASGMYYYQLQSDDMQLTKRMTLMK